MARSGVGGYQSEYREGKRWCSCDCVCTKGGVVDGDASAVVAAGTPAKGAGTGESGVDPRVTRGVVAFVGVGYTVEGTGQGGS